MFNTETPRLDDQNKVPREIGVVTEKKEKCVKHFWDDLQLQTNDTRIDRIVRINQLEIAFTAAF